MSEEILNQLAADMNKLLTEPVGSRSVKITDLTPRDGQQCKLATRVTTDDLLPLCASIDNCGFYAVEVWGGATFDVCMRYLKEDPWDRLRRIKAVMPKTKLQMLLRGQHILAYRPYTDKIVCKFVERAIANGMNVFRIFEATNDFRNIEAATKAVKELGGEAHVEVNYTVSPVHTLEKWMEYAEQLIEVGADWLSLKDATGIMTPFDSYRIIKGIKDRAQGQAPGSAPLSRHGRNFEHVPPDGHSGRRRHDRHGVVAAVVRFGASRHRDDGGVVEGHAVRYRDRREASGRAGADHPADQRKVRKVRDGIYRRQRRCIYSQGSRRNDLEYGGATERSQADGLDGRGAERNAQRRERSGPSAAADAHQPDRRRPSGTNVLAGERYKIVSRETSDYVKGKYGRPPGQVNRDLMKKIMKDKEPDYSLRSGEMADPADWDKAIKDLGPLAKSDEDVLLGVLFPMQAKEFLTLRESAGAIRKFQTFQSFQSFHRFRSGRVRRI